MMGVDDAGGPGPRRDAKNLVDMASAEAAAAVAQTV